jgi:hypothetical protein
VSALRELVGTLGEFRDVPGRRGVVVGVPHGTFDEDTDRIGERVAGLTGAGALIATGFCAARTDGVRLNVNRPTEGASRRASEEAVTPRAVAVHAAYLRRVRAAARGGLGLYLEVHGNSRPATASRIEVATAGIDETTARRLKDAARSAVAALGEATGALLTLSIEPLDALHLSASAARRWPPFSEARRVLHVELPQAARQPGLAADSAALLIAALLCATEDPGR